MAENNINLDDEYIKEYSNITEHFNSLRKEIEDSIEKVLSQHSTYYFQKLGVGSASIQSLKNPELRSKMNIDTLLRLLQRMISKNQDDESMKKYNKAKELYEQAKSLVLELIETELSIHSQSFYVREKGIGSASIQKLAHEKESMRVENLFNLYERMI